MGIRLTSAFIFDFDGTLVDSEQAIYQCFQSITKQLAPERMEYAKNILIGPPLMDTASDWPTFRRTDQFAYSRWATKTDGVDNRGRRVAR